MRESVELIATEFVSLIIVVTMLVVLLRSRRRGDGPMTASFLAPFWAFAAYLLIAIPLHLILLQIIVPAPTVVRVLFGLHLATLPLFVTIWSVGIQGRITRTRGRQLTVTIPLVLAALFIGSLMLDVPYGVLFHYNGDGVLSGGIGITIMLTVNAIILISALLSIITHRIMYPGFSRIGLGFAIAVLSLSLFFFHFFRNPNLVAISGTFTLLFSFFAWQRRELTLDALTKIPNYTAYRSALGTITAHNEKRTLVMVDIENFRLINDRHGSDGGDQVLIWLAGALDTLSSEAIAYRLHSNRFVLIAPNLSHNKIVRLVNQIRSAAAIGTIVGGEHIAVHLHIAILQTPVGG